MPGSTSHDQLLDHLKTLHEDDRSWELILTVMDSMPTDLVSVLWAASIPHWYNPEIIAVLCPEITGSIVELCKQLAEYSFIEEFPKRGQNIHDLTRGLLLSKMPDDQFHLLSNRAACYFAGTKKKQPTQSHIPTGDDLQIAEWIYHDMVCNPKLQDLESCNHIINCVPEYRRAGLEYMIKLRVKEHLSTGRIPTTPIDY